MLTYKTLEKITKQNNNRDLIAELIQKQDYRHYLKDPKTFYASYEIKKPSKDIDYRIYPYYIAVNKDKVLTLYETKTDKEIQKYKTDIVRNVFYFYNRYGKQTLLEFIKSQIEEIIKQLYAIQILTNENDNNIERFNSYKAEFIKLLNDATENTITNFIYFVDSPILLNSLSANAQLTTPLDLSTYFERLKENLKTMLREDKELINNLNENDNKIIETYKEYRKAILDSAQKVIDKNRQEGHELYKIIKIIEIKQDSNIANVETELLTALDLLERTEAGKQLKKIEEDIKKRKQDREKYNQEANSIAEQVKELLEDITKTQAELSQSGLYKFINRLYNDIFFSDYKEKEDFSAIIKSNEPKDIKIYSANNVINSFLQIFSGADKVIDKHALEEIKKIPNYEQKIQDANSAEQAGLPRGSNKEDILRVIKREQLETNIAVVNRDIKRIRDKKTDKQIRLLEEQGANDNKLAFLIQQKEKEKQQTLAKLNESKANYEIALQEYNKNIFFYNDAYYITKKPYFDYIEDKKTDKIRLTNKEGTFSVLKSRQTQAEESELTAFIFAKTLNKLSETRNYKIVFSIEEILQIMKQYRKEYNYKKLEDLTSKDKENLKAKFYKELLLLRGIDIDIADLKAKGTIKYRFNSKNSALFLSVENCKDSTIKCIFNEELAKLILEYAYYSNAYYPYDLFYYDPKTALLAIGIVNLQSQHRDTGYTGKDLLPYTLGKNYRDLLVNYIRPAKEKGLITLPTEPKTENETFNNLELTHESQASKIMRLKRAEQAKKIREYGFKKIQEKRKQLKKHKYK